MLSMRPEYNEKVRIDESNFKSIKLSFALSKWEIFLSKANPHKVVFLSPKSVITPRQYIDKPHAQKGKALRWNCGELVIPTVTPVRAPF